MIPLIGGVFHFLVDGFKVKNKVCLEMILFLISSYRRTGHNQHYLFLNINDPIERSQFYSVYTSWRVYILEICRKSVSSRYIRE
jgi:hypothetical protein